MRSCRCSYFALSKKAEIFNNFARKTCEHLRDHQAGRSRNRGSRAARSHPEADVGTDSGSAFDVRCNSNLAQRLDPRFTQDQPRGSCTISSWLPGYWPLLPGNAGQPKRTSTQARCRMERICDHRIFNVSAPQSSVLPCNDSPSIPPRGAPIASHHKSHPSHPRSTAEPGMAD